MVRWSVWLPHSLCLHGLHRARDCVWQSGTYSEWCCWTSWWREGWSASDLNINMRFGMLSKSFSNADIDESILITYFMCNTMPFRFFHMAFNMVQIKVPSCLHKDPKRYEATRFSTTITCFTSLTICLSFLRIFNTSQTGLNLTVLYDVDSCWKTSLIANRHFVQHQGVQLFSSKVYVFYLQSTTVPLVGESTPALIIRTWSSLTMQVSFRQLNLEPKRDPKTAMLITDITDIN